MYAQWRINVVYIKYSVNGGTITSSAGGYKWTTKDGIIYKDGVVETYEINYGSKLSSDGLANWSNSSYIKVSKQEYTAVSDAEWKCLSGCTTAGKTFDHTVAYSASDFCDASNGDCTVVVGVNWTPARVCYKVTADGGLNCRKSKSIDSDKVTGLSEGGYYMFKYSETIGSYKWYYNSSSGCYAVGHNGTKSWLSYHDTSCSSSGGSTTPSNPSTGGSCTISGLCVCQEADNFDKEYTLDCKKYGLSNATACSTTCRGVTKYSTCTCK